MKIKKSFLLLLTAVICIGCFSACGNENVYGFNKEEKQAITASMEVGLSEETFELSLGHNIMVIKLNHPAVEEFFDAQEKYYNDMNAWREYINTNGPDLSTKPPQKPDNFIRINLISNLNASAFTEFYFQINGNEFWNIAEETPLLSYNNIDNNDYSTSMEDSVSKGLTYEKDSDGVKIILRAPGYTTTQLEDMQILIETQDGILGADADPATNYEIPEYITNATWELDLTNYSCKDTYKEYSYFMYTDYLKQTTNDYMLKEISVTSYDEGHHNKLHDYVITYAYYFDETGALADADVITYYKIHPENYAENYAEEEQNIGGVEGLFRSSTKIEEIILENRPKPSYFYTIDSDSYIPYPLYFSNPVLTSEQLCNLGELGYSY